MAARRFTLFVCAFVAACSRPPPPVSAPSPSPSPMSPSPPSSPAQVIILIARDIERLKPVCPQLAEFTIERDAHRSGSYIDYDYHTHRSTKRGGWAAAAPEPDPDGVWLYVDIHNPRSMAQIHTQPGEPMLHVGNGLLMMLMLEGDGVPTCSEKVWAILQKYGKAGEVM